jgi:Rho GTPase-activating protein RGD1
VTLIATETDTREEFAHFCLGRSKIETERRKSLERICKSTRDEVRRPEGRQNSYVKGIQDIIKVFEQMADHGHKFSLKLTQIQIILDKLAENTERKRKDIRQLGLAEEKRVQDAERQVEKAKEKYYRLAQDLYHQKRNPKASSNLHFTLSGPKSIGQFEGDLNNKVELADSEYRAKVAIANDMRQNLVLTLRPNAVKSLLSSISEIDTALKRSMEEVGK